MRSSWVGEVGLLVSAAMVVVHSPQASAMCRDSCLVIIEQSKTSSTTLGQGRVQSTKRHSHTYLPKTAEQKRRRPLCDGDALSAALKHFSELTMLVVVLQAEK